MPDVILSLNSNILKATLVTKEGFAKNSIEVSKESCDDTHILEPQMIAEIIKGSLDNLSLQKKKLSLNFLVEPKDVVLKFITVKKSEDSLEDQILDEVKKNLEGVTIDELYFSYQRIAPFIYQFIGIRKADLEKYIEVSTILGLPLRSVVSWVSMVPKYLKENKPFIFLNYDNNKTNLALSELGGVFFTQTFNKKISGSDLSSLVDELSVYEKTESISKIYTLGVGVSKIGTTFEVNEVTLPIMIDVDSKDYEKHILAHYMLDQFEDSLLSQVNLLNLLPVPVVEKKSSALVYVGSSVASLLLVGGLIFSIAHFKNKNATTIPSEITNNGSVLSELTEVQKETTEEQKEEQKQSEENTKKEELERKDLTILVENGTDITGLGGRTKSFLEKLGYKVKGVGDAEVTGRQNTLLKFKKDKVNFKDMLISDMKDKYTDIVIEDDLDEKSDYDLLIIVGTKVNGI